MLAACCLLLLWFAPPPILQGTVRDAQTGEPLARVSVKLAGVGLGTETDSAGAFSLPPVDAGQYHLVVSTVGYRLMDKRIELKPGDTASVDLALSPESAQHKDRVDVHEDPFDLDPADSPTGFSISGAEAKNLASVLADDPLRAVHSAPGVAANDDFDSRFTLHAAPYDQVGLYLDGILLHSPFHTVQGEGPSGSTAAFNGDMVSAMSIESEGYGPQFENRTGGVLDIHTREGSRDQIHFRVNASLPDAGALAEGPFGKAHKGSWLVSARKSYLQYFLQNLAQDVPSMAFGFADTQAQLNYRLTDHNAFSLKLIDGTSELDRSSAKSLLGNNSALLARYHYTLANAGWLYTPNHSFVVNTRAAFTRERYDDKGLFSQPLGDGYYGEWVAKSDATWAWTDNARFDFGGVVRPTRAEGFANYYFDQTRFTTTDAHRGGDVFSGGYAQQSFSALGKRVSLSFGGRWDTLSANRQSAVSPQAAVSYAPWSSGRLSFTWGRYAQFPEASSLYAENGSSRLLPARSEQYAITFQQRLGTQTRFRVEAFRRNANNLLFQPFLEARLLNGVISPDDFQYPLLNSLTNRAQGVEVFLQRRTANGWTGWVSYTLMHSESHDRVAQIGFPSDFDQRHTVNTYLSYRLRPSVNLSAKFAYGSGFPIPGFFGLQGGDYYLAASRNALRIPAYERLDLRMNKSKTLSHGKMTVFVEVTNVLNHANYRFDSYNGYDSSNGLASVSLAKMFPILPSAGISYEF